MTPTYETVRTAIDRLCRDSFFYVHLEPTNACNTNCMMCPRDAMHRSMKLMDWATLERVVAVLLPVQVPMVSIVGFGEPTLHPRLDDMIRYIKGKRPDVIVKMTTNGSRLNPRVIDSLYDAGLDLMEISVVGADPDTYTSAMGGLDLSAVLRAIEYLNDAGHQYLLATFPLGNTSAESLRQYWTSQGARHLEVKGFHRRGGYLQPAEVQGNPFGEYRTRLHPPRADSSETTPAAFPVDACHKLYMFLHVNANGNLIPCVQEINDKNVLSHVSALRHFDEVRQLLRTHRPTFDICQGCELQSQDQLDYYARFMLTYFPDRIDTLARSTLVSSQVGAE